MSPDLMKTKVLEKPIGILTLAQQIGALHLDIEGRNEEMFSLLTQAKKDAGEDGWLKWLADNKETLGFGERQAQRYLREPDVRTSDLAKEAKRQKERRAAAKAPKVAATGSGAAGDDPVLEDEDGVEPEVESEGTTLAQGSKKTTAVEASANEQPTPKKLKHGSRPWFKERVAHLSDVVRDLREAVPELQGRLYSQGYGTLFMDIVAAQEALGHVVRIATDPVGVKKVSLALVKLWNQQKGEQLEGKYCSESLMSKVNEAVACACELDLDRWARVVETIAGKDPSWFTRDNFNDLISTRDGRPDGLEKLEDQEGLPAWGSEAAGTPLEPES